MRIKHNKLHDGHRYTIEFILHQLRNGSSFVRPGALSSVLARSKDVHEAGAAHMLLPGFDVVAASHDPSAAAHAGGGEARGSPRVGFGWLMCGSSRQLTSKRLANSSFVDVVEKDSVALESARKRHFCMLCPPCNGRCGVQPSPTLQEDDDIPNCEFDLPPSSQPYFIVPSAAKGQQLLLIRKQQSQRLTGIHPEMEA